MNDHKCTTKYDTRTDIQRNRKCPKSQINLENQLLTQGDVNARSKKIERCRI